jgi:hypothetical protein
LDTLKRKKRDRDPTCVGCHVTGYLQPGGTRDLALATGRLRDVGCESCHGPGAEHARNPKGAQGQRKGQGQAQAQGQSPANQGGIKAGIKLKVEAATCLGCHTPDQTNGEFDYPSFRKAILGPGHEASL